MENIHHPEVSIIVPVYKIPEQYLRHCIESLMAQTLKNIEILLVDDGSPDNCGIICDEYHQKDNRISVIHKMNSGVGSARNVGFLVARGTWISFVDGDDFVEPDMCETAIGFGVAHDLELVMFGYYRDIGHTSTECKRNLEDGKIYSTEKECAWLRNQVLYYNSNIISVYAKLFKRDYLVKNNLLHDESIGQNAEDLEFNFRVFSHLSKAGFISKPLYHYIYNPESLTSKLTEKSVRDAIKAMKKVKSIIEKDKDKEQLLPLFYNRMMYVIVTTMISGFFNPASHYSYKESKTLFNRYIAIPIVSEALKSKDYFDLSKERKIILSIIRHHNLPMLRLLGKMRHLQKRNS